jgi:hypothetical protein
VSGASIAADAGSRPSRYHILYPRQNLKEFRGMLVVWLLAAVGLSAYEALALHRRQDAMLSLLYAFFPIAFGLALYLFGALATVSFDEDGMRIRYGPFRRARVDFADIERARLETVEHLWQRSGRKSTRMIRSLYKQKSLCVQLKGDGRMGRDLARRLGGRLVFEGDLVIPITHVEDAMGAIKDGLLQRRSAVAPPRRGHRRGKRGRR